jgi:LCP family protein required for cell wall assembly
MSFSIRRLDENKDRWYRHVPWKKLALTSLTMGRPLLHWYQDFRERKAKQRRVAILKRILILLVAILLALFIFAGITKAFLGVRSLGLQTFLALTGDPPPVDSHGFTNVLLLGEGDETGERLVDSIIVASIDPHKTRSAILISLPRDLYFLKTEKMGKGRLNSMYRDYRGYLRYQGNDDETASHEALKELMHEVGRKFEMEIHTAIKVNFDGFTEAVDAVGGVDIEVPYDIIDTKYPGPNYTYQTFEIKQGPQHLDGATALKYARSRNTTSDFARSQRQQQILSALAGKVEVKNILKNPSRLTSLVNILGQHIETTMTLRELIGLAGLGLDIDREHIVTMQLHDRNGLYGDVLHEGGFLYTPPRDLFEGASVLLPISIPEFPVTWKQMRTLKKLMIDLRTIHIKKPTISVLNAGAPSGHARKLANELLRYGLPVQTIANATMDQQDTSLISTPHEDHKDILDTFSTTLDISPSPLPPLESEEIRDITIILGRDYTFTRLQDVVK